MEMRFDSELTERIYWLAQTDGVIDKCIYPYTKYYLLEVLDLCEFDYAILRVTGKLISADYYDKEEALVEWNYLKKN